VDAQTVCASGSLDAAVLLLYLCDGPPERHHSRESALAPLNIHAMLRLGLACVSITSILRTPHRCSLLSPCPASVQSITALAGSIPAVVNTAADLRAKSARIDAAIAAAAGIEDGPRPPPSLGDTPPAAAHPPAGDTPAAAAGAVGSGAASAGASDAGNSAAVAHTSPIPPPAPAAGSGGKAQDAMQLLD
jgi:hypothetical protein